MAQPLSNDLRERVVMAVARDGLSRNQAAARFGIAVSTADTWVKRFLATGSLAPGQMGGHKPATLSGAHREWRLARCAGGDFTLRGLVAELATERGVKVDYVSVWRFVHAEGRTHKKERRGQRARPPRCRPTPGAVAAPPRADRPQTPGVYRLVFIDWCLSTGVYRLVFIDETWTKTNLAPLRGWAPKGERLPGKSPYGHCNTMTFLAALRHDRIEAPFLLAGAIDRESVLAYVEQVLAPTLRRGDLVVADNRACHKHPAVRRAIRAAGARLLRLPKYSPDLAPIEQVFAKLKHLLRKAAARSREAVCAAIGQLLQSFTPQACANYLAISGYDRRDVIAL